MPYAPHQFTSRVDAAVPDAYGELWRLACDLDETLSKIAGTSAQDLPRTEMLLEAVDCLLDTEDPPNVPECVGYLTAITTVYLDPKHKNRSHRAARRDNAVKVLTAVSETLDMWMSVNADSQELDEVELLSRTLKDTVTKAEGAEFPTPTRKG